MPFGKAAWATVFVMSGIGGMALGLRVMVFLSPFIRFAFHPYNDFVSVVSSPTVSNSPLLRHDHDRALHHRAVNPAVVGKGSSRRERMRIRLTRIERAGIPTRHRRTNPTWTGTTCRRVWSSIVILPDDSLTSANRDGRWIESNVAHGDHDLSCTRRCGHRGRGWIARH